MHTASLRVGQQSLLGYLPAIVIQKILEGEIDSTKNLPAYHKIYTVSLFADISGFTKLSESFSKKGRIGPEFLAFSLNRYMEQLSKNGGDIFKFAGDAILVVWPPVSKIEESCQRAIQCALDIQGKLNNQEISPNKRLSVKIGIGVGECTILVVGGQFGRCEYLCVGDALAQACEAETKATEGGQTICSEDVKQYVYNKFDFQEIVGGDDDHGHGPTDSNMKFFKIIKITGDRVQIKADAFLMRTKFSLEKLREKLSVLKAFVPASIVKYLDIEKEVWSKEIRMISSMFLNLKVDLKQTKSDEGIQRIQKIVKTVQRCVYRTKGSLNKFLMDDKGSVMVICWGLPPLSAPDDHIRSVLCGQTLITELKNLKCGAYMGLATGTCFTGVCGTIGGRREYSLLGEIVNLSARHMQKAITYANDLSSEKNVKVEYLCLIDERTKDLMQNKIFSQYLCKGIPKGFQFEFNFYEPLQDTRSTYDFDVNLFPEIKTHKNNVPMYQLPSDNNKDQKHFHNKSLHLIGKRKELDFCKKIINETWKTNNSVSILIRGVFGSGKSLFCRKLLHEFFDQNKDLKQKLIQNSFDMPFVLITYQVPTMSFNPFNGWQSILREIYNVINNDLIKKKEGKSPYEISIGSEKLSINCDLFGKLILKSENYSNIRYLEEILGINLSNHIDEPNDENFIKFFKISQIKETDLFFFPRIFNKNEHTISKFFLKMIKRYRQLLDENCQEESNKYPLIFVIEDCHLIDEISVEFITLVETKIKNVIILCTYQDLICSIIQNPFDKFAKSLDFFGERVVSMENINDLHECEELIKNNLEGRLNIEKIDPELINIIIPKTFQGNPLFILDIIDSLIDSNKYVQHPGQELLTTSELIDMDNEQDWISFNVPIRMEKLIGHIIDSLECKEIILLKYAATIGNIFDLDKLSKLNPFNNCTFDDLYSILQRFEVQGLIEILYDLEPKKMVCKFAIPFCREILYQRMLIEQRNDIHMNIARQMQYSKFSYMTSKREVDLLKSHLKKTEKSIINYMEEDDNEPSHRDETKFSTTTNQKIVLVKEICQKLKIIDLKLEEDEQVNKGIPLILEGILSKQSDANITWENRYIVITNKRFYYYYTDKDYKENKEPLGYFEMKNLYNLQILADYQYGSKKNIFTITVSQWQKKDQVKPGRSYKLSADSKEKLNDWVTTLNFLRVKATYDEFACQFGLINLPLPHEVLDKNKKNIKKKFVPTNLNHQKMAKTSNNYYNSIARKSIISSKTTQNSDKMRNSNFGRHSSMVNLTEHINEDQDNLMKTTKVKENISNVFSLGIVCFLGFIQDIVFNLEKFGNSDDKTIVIPKNLKEFRDITPELLTKENREERSTSRTKLPTRIKEENEEEESFSNKELEVINPERSLDRKNEMPPEAQYISKLKNKDIDEKMNNEDKINLDIKEEMNNDGNNKTKKQSYLNTEKLNPNIKIKPINILNANEIVNKVLKSNDDNHISNKLKNFDIMIDEDDIYFENNQNLNSNNIENDNSKKNNNKKEEKSSYMESDKYKDVKIPQKYNNYSSNVFKNKLKK